MCRKAPPQAKGKKRPPSCHFISRQVGRMVWWAVTHARPHRSVGKPSRLQPTYSIHAYGHAWHWAGHHMLCKGKPVHGVNPWLVNEFLQVWHRDHDCKAHASIPLTHSLVINFPPKAALSSLLFCKHLPVHPSTRPSVHPPQFAHDPIHPCTHPLVPNHFSCPSTDPQLLVALTTPDLVGCAADGCCKGGRVCLMPCMVSARLVCLLAPCRPPPCS